MDVSLQPTDGTTPTLWTFRLYSSQMNVKSEVDYNSLHAIHFWKLAALSTYLRCLLTKQKPVFFPTTTSSTTVPEYQITTLVTY